MNRLFRRLLTAQVLMGVACVTVANVNDVPTVTRAEPSVA